MADDRLKGKVAVVTGGSRGIGRGISIGLGAAGADVGVNYRGNQEEAEEVVETIQKLGGRALAVRANVADRGEVEDMFDLVRRELGGVDVLVNNAGGPRPGGFDALDDDAWRAAYELNLMSTVRLIRGVLPHMREQRWGRIVTVASSSIKQPIENLLLSNTYRVAILGLAKSLAIELAPDGILINTVGPGRIATDRVAGLDATRAEKAGTSIEEVRAQAEKAIPLGRYGTAEEFGKVAAFLVSGANTYTTGQHFLVDGGMVKAI
jgi:3-oxoacyl-[acyl-carrier protein] reductase